MTVSDIKKLDDMGLKAWDQHDPEAFANLFADKFTWVDDGVPEPIRTKDELREYMKSWFTAFPDMRVKAVNRVFNDDAVGAEIEITGTNKGPLHMAGQSIPATGKKINAHGTYFVKVKNGKVVEFHSHPNLAEMMGQLGVAGGTGGTTGGTTGKTTGGKTTGGKTTGGKTTTGKTTGRNAR